MYNMHNQAIYEINIERASQHSTLQMKLKSTHK